MLEYKSRTEVVSVVPGVVQHEVVTYDFSDGVTITHTTEWELKPRAGWRSGRTMVHVGDKKSTSTKLLSKLSEAKRVFE